MMLGIRVMTGRKELYSYEHSGDDNEGGRELTDADYDYELELNFPPEGTGGKGVGESIINNSLC